MKLHLTVQAAVMSLCLGLLANGEAQAYTFTKIADTSGSLTSFLGGVAINDGGTVAFFASLDAGGRGIFTSEGTAITTIFEDHTIVDFSFAGLSINNSGTVVFAAGPIPSNNLFISDGTTTSTLVDTTGRFSDLFFPSINNKGTVAFAATLDNSEGLGFFTSDGTTTTTIATFFSGGFGQGTIDINDAGTVAVGFDKGGAEQVFTIFSSDGTTITPIPNPSSGFPTVGTTVSINNQGMVAFAAGSSQLDSSVFVSNGTTTSTIANTRGSFSLLFPIAINDQGTVAFQAFLDVGGTGIFTGPDPVADKIIATGDPLFGSTVTVLSSYAEGLNNSGQVAFFAQLADGTQGIFRAEPENISTPPEAVPEPASALGLLTFGAFGASSLLKHKLQKQINSAS